MSGTQPIFELHGVSKAFGGVNALQDMTLQIHQGERVALVGPSGAGKSTLLHILNGTFEASTGEVVVLGHNLAHLSPRARRMVQRQIGTMYQQLHLVDNLKVIHNVNAGQLGRWSFARALVSLLWPLDVQQASRALHNVGVADKLYARTDELSGGQQQRVALARVLVQDPVAILADEPIASLDPERSRDIMDLLRDLSRQTGKTLVTTLHLIEYAQSHFDRVIGLRDGRMVFDLPNTALTPRHVQALYTIDNPVGRSRDQPPQLI